MSLKKELDHLALELVKSVRKASPGADGVKLEEQLDVFKAVTAYQLGLTRAFKGKAPDEAESTSFKSIIARANGKQQTAAKEQDDA